MGLSGVSHAGYLLVGVIAAYREPLAVGAVYFYLLAYLLASFAVFAVMAHVSGGDDADQDLEHYANLARERPFLGAVLAIGLGSLAGIPPLAGFMGKLLIFIFAFKAGPLRAADRGRHRRGDLDLLLLRLDQGGVFPGVASAAGGSGDSNGAVPVIARVGLPVAAAMVLLAAGSVLLGFYQGPLGAWLLAR